MWLILIIIIEMLMSGLLNSIIPSEISQYFLIFINIFFMVFYLNKYIKNKNILYIFYFGFLIRLIFLFVDIHIGSVPFGGADTEKFHFEALLIYENFPLGWQDSASGQYTNMISTIYYCMAGTTRLFAQFINIILFMLSSLLCIRIFQKYEVKINIQKIVSIVLIFIPVGIFESVILLREMIMIFFIAYSIFYLIIWMDEGKVRYAIFSSIMLYLGSMFHSGIRITLLFYLLVFVLYDYKKQKFKINILKVLLVLGAIVSIAILTNVISTDTIFDKLGGYERMMDRAGSAYLTNLEISEGWQLLLYSPLKLFYFLFAPMPWMFRGIMDIVTFFTDSIIYVYGCIIFFKYWKIRKIINQKISDRILVLYISYLILILPYSWGTISAGTAIRHRYKAFIFLVIASALYLNSKKEIQGEN